MSDGVLLSVAGVHKRFGGLAALTDVSLELHEKEILGLIGPNGAGKTTLFNVIAGVYRPDRGAVLFRGRDISNLRPDQRCHLGIARTFQITQPFLGLSLLENVTVGAYFGHSPRPSLSAARDLAAATLQLVKLGHRTDEPANRLTLGERKKLELARALATRPSVLLLDEVVAGLNPAETAEILDVIRGIRAGGVAVLMIEHVMHAVMGISERVMVLHYGRVLAEGTPAEVVKDERVITAYLGSVADVVA